MATPCINPETAMFPEFDFWWLDLFVSRGIDMPCEFYGFLLNLAICGAVALAMGVTLLFWYVWTYRARHAYRSEAALNREIGLMMRKRDLRNARRQYSTRGKYFLWTH